MKENEFLGFNPHIPAHYQRKRHYILVDAACNIYSSMLLEPYAAAQVNQNLTDQLSPYIWIEAPQS